MGTRRCLALLMAVTALLAAPALQAPAEAFHERGNCGGNQGARMMWIAAHGAFPINPMQAVPGANWQAYMHPVFPVMSFLYPPGWQPQTVAQSSVSGVRLIGLGGQAVFDYFIFSETQITHPRQAVGIGLTNLLGQNARVNLLCADDWSDPGVGQVYSLAIVSSGGTIVSVQGTVLSYGPGIALYQGSKGPTQQFASLVARVYLPIVYQWLAARDPGSEGDADGDGVPNSRDQYPNDPSRH